MNSPTEVLNNLYVGNVKCLESKVHFDGIVSVMVKPPEKVLILVVYSSNEMH